MSSVAAAEARILRQEIAGGAHVGMTGLCWFCWLKAPEGLALVEA